MSYYHYVCYCVYRLIVLKVQKVLQVVGMALISVQPLLLIVKMIKVTMKES